MKDKKRIKEKMKQKKMMIDALYLKNDRTFIKNKIKNERYS